MRLRIRLPRSNVGTCRLSLHDLLSAVLAAITDPHPERDESHSATRYRE